MHLIGTITPQFQLHIPIAIRKATGLQKHGKVTIRAQDNRIIIEPLKSDVLSLAGKYRVKNPIPVETIRDYIDYGNL